MFLVGVRFIFRLFSAKRRFSGMTALSRTGRHRQNDGLRKHTIHHLTISSIEWNP